MNCQEARNLVERVLDRNLSGCTKRRFDLHLSRCKECRAFLAAEQAEHQRWFKAVNSPDEPLHSLSPDFADRLVAAIAARSVARRPFFMRLPRWALIAASLALMAGFVFAAAVAAGHGVFDAPDGDATAGRGVLDAPVANQLENAQGETSMKKKVLAAALAATLTAMPSPNVMAVDIDMAASEAAGLASGDFEGVVTHPTTFASQATSIAHVFLSRTSTYGTAGTDTFLSRFCTKGDSLALASFNSTEPTGFTLILR